MNKFVKEEYDKFKQKNVICFKEDIEAQIKNYSQWAHDVKYGFRQVSMPDFKSEFLLDITFVSSSGIGFDGGELQLIIDGSQHLSFQLKQSFSDRYLESFHIESYFCELTEEDVKKICDASSIDLRISNDRDYIELSTEELQLAARIMYNAIVDKNAYVKEILQIANKQKAEKFAKDKKETLIWMWILGVILFILGIFTWWWCWFAGILMAGGYTSYYISKKNSILNNADIE